MKIKPESIIAFIAGVLMSTFFVVLANDLNWSILKTILLYVFFITGLTIYIRSLTD